MQDAAARREKKRKRSTIPFPENELFELLETEMEDEKEEEQVDDFSPLYVEEFFTGSEDLFSKIEDLKKELDAEIAVYGPDHIRVSIKRTDIARIYVVLWKGNIGEEKERREGGVYDIFEHIDHALQIQLANKNFSQCLLTLETLGNLYDVLGKTSIAYALWKYVLESFCVQMQQAPDIECVVHFSEIGTHLVRLYCQNAQTDAHRAYAFRIAKYVVRAVQACAPNGIDPRVVAEELSSCFSPEEQVRMQDMQGMKPFSPRSAETLSQALFDLIQRHIEERQEIHTALRIPAAEESILVTFLQSQVQTPSNTPSTKMPMPLPSGEILEQFSFLNGEGGGAAVHNIESASSLTA